MRSINGYCGRWMVLAALVSMPLISPAQGSANEESVKAVWQPKIYKFDRYQKMLSKEPFGKVPVNVHPPAVVVEKPVEEKQLAIAAVSVVEGKPVVYLIDLKTRAYQKINTEEENESKIRLVEISDESNPRDVVAKVLINGSLSTVKYDSGLLGAKPKLASKRGRKVNNVAGNKVVQPPRITRASKPPNTALMQNTNRAQSSVRAGQLAAAGRQAPAPVVRSIQDQRRLSTVPRGQVIVPGKPTSQQPAPTERNPAQP